MSLFDHMSSNTRRLFCGVGLVLLSGCSLTMGEDEFSCSGLPDRKFCMNAWEVYAATNDRDSLEGYVPAGETVNGDIAQADSSKNTEKPKGPTQGSLQNMTQRQIPAPLPPGITVPVRSPAKVIRIWFAPYEDKGALVAPSYVFTEVESRRWMLGLDEPSESKNITPLKVITQERGL